MEEFNVSGNRLVDRLWGKPATTISQRQAIATNLFETLLAGSSRNWRVPVHCLIKRLPLPWKVYWSLYGYRTLRGDPSLWADTVVALLVRMPLATKLYHSEHYGHAQSVIRECLYALMFFNINGFDLEPRLASKVLELLDVVEWYANNQPNEKSIVGLAIVPLADFIYNHEKHGKLTGEIRERFLEFYRFLDASIDVSNGTNSALSSMHKYLFDALGDEAQPSILLSKLSDVDKLVFDFRENLSGIIGSDLSDMLISNDPKKLTDFLESSPVRERADVLIRLLEARKLWWGDVSINDATTYGALHRELYKFICWKDLNEIIRKIADMQMDVSDQQMTELVDSLAGTGNIIAEVTVKRALACCKMGGYPRTLHALKNLPVTGEMTVTPFFDKTLKLARRGLARL